MQQYFNDQNSEFEFIAVGQGTTSAQYVFLHYFMQLYRDAKVFVTEFDHHSSMLSYLSKNYTVNVIYLDKNCNADEKQIKFDEKRMNLLSITASSNVSGQKINLQWFNKLVKNNKKQYKIWFHVDYAVLASSYPLDLQKLDEVCSVVLSGHKLLGGTMTPGLLVIKKALINGLKQYNIGGGSSDGIAFLKKNPEVIDNSMVTYDAVFQLGGSSNSAGFVKLGLCMSIVVDNQQQIAEKIKTLVDFIGKRVKDFEWVNIKPMQTNQVSMNTVCMPIMNFYGNDIKEVHQQITTVVCRYGVQCSSLFKNYIGVQNWIRFSFSFKTEINEIEYVIKLMHEKDAEISMRNNDENQTENQPEQQTYNVQRGGRSTDEIIELTQRQETELLNIIHRNHGKNKRFKKLSQEKIDDIMQQFYDQYQIELPDQLIASMHSQKMIMLAIINKQNAVNYIQSDIENLKQYFLKPRGNTQIVKWLIQLSELVKYPPILALKHVKKSVKNISEDQYKNIEKKLEKYDDYSNCNIEQKENSLAFEKEIEQLLKERKISFSTEETRRNKENITPDFLIYGNKYKWIEAKNFYGKSDGILKKKIIEQIEKY